jgi:hypothetical protein
LIRASSAQGIREGEVSGEENQRWREARTEAAARRRRPPTNNLNGCDFR